MMEWNAGVSPAAAWIAERAHKISRVVDLFNTLHLRQARSVNDGDLTRTECRGNLAVENRRETVVAPVIQRLVHM